MKIEGWSYNAKVIFGEIWLSANFGHWESAPKEYLTQEVIHAFMAGLNFGEESDERKQEYIERALKLDAEHRRRPALKLSKRSCPGHQRGEKHHKAKLTAEQVREIRERLKAGEKTVALAKEFGVNQTSLHQIKMRQTWKHIP